MIPALRAADFVRYGVMHRNTYIDSPRLLDRYYRVKTRPELCFGGQVSGEHGIGFAKKEYLAHSLSPEVMRLIAGIKDLFDPDHLLNPGKVVS